MTIIALTSLLRPRTSKIFRDRLILFLTDNQSSLPWDQKARCPFFPWWRFSKLQLVAEIVLDSKFVFKYISTERQEADILTRGESHFLVGTERRRATHLPTKICRFIAQVLDGSCDFQQLFAHFALEEIIKSKRLRVGFFFSFF
jgi:hypothetical protein